MNPFATRFVRPGALPFLPGKNDSVPAILARLKSHAGWGEIIGPHGSGKSTLLAAMLPELEGQGAHVVPICLHEGERFSLSEHRPETWQATTQVVVDGYEQLSRWAGWRLRRYCRRRGTGLLITAHATTGLPTLYETRVETQVAHELIARLLAEQANCLGQEDIDTCLRRHPQNLREAFFALYDLYESQGSLPGVPTIPTA